MTDIKFFKLREFSINQADVYAVMADVERAEAGEGCRKYKVNLVMVCDKVMNRRARNGERQ